jgi:predicted NAD/FAD-binding protein
MLSTEKKRVAIVGSGCAGLGAAWALQNTDHEVHIFEKSDRLGGHTNTQTFTHGDHSTPVDTGFIVMNSATYRSSQQPYSPVSNRNTNTAQQT